MALGKYYCDYCDKQFQDTALARKRHFQGVQHQRAKSLWYNSFNAPPNLLHSSGAPGRPLCNFFITNGYCNYGDSCRYFHPPNQSLQSSNQPKPDVLLKGVGTSFSNLPHSLRPPPEGGYPPLPFIDWG